MIWIHYDWWPFGPNSCQFAAYLSVAQDWVIYNGLHLQWVYLLNTCYQGSTDWVFQVLPSVEGENCSGPMDPFSGNLRISGKSPHGSSVGFSPVRRYLHATINQLVGTDLTSYNRG